MTLFILFILLFILFITLYLFLFIFGVDSPIYGTWLCAPEEVYDGSLAMCLSIRPFANAEKG